MGASRTFTASTNEVRCGSDTTLDNIFDGGGSLAAWIFPTTSGAGEFPRVMTKNNSAGGDGWRLTSSDTPALVMFFGFTGSSGIWFIALTFGVWQHIAYVYNADSNANLPKMYLNGVDTTVSVNQAPTGTRDPDTSDIFIIANRIAQTTGWVGDMCHCQAWDRSITDAEVLEVMHKPGSVPRNTVGYWNLFGVNSPEIDYSVNTNDGTVTGSTVSFNGPPINRAG